MPTLKIEAADALRLVLEDARHTTCDLSDLLTGHVAANAGCETVLTFDKKASRYALFRMLHV
jgi:predicted nucleic-acid-binding protein